MHRPLMEAQNAHDDAEMYPQEEHAQGAACVTHVSTGDHHEPGRADMRLSAQDASTAVLRARGEVQWVLMGGLPLWSTGQLTPDRRETLIACLVGIVLVPLVMPSGDVLNRYVKAPGDPWRKRMISSAPEQSSSRSPPTASARL